MDFASTNMRLAPDMYYEERRYGVGYEQCNSLEIEMGINGLCMDGRLMGK